MKDLIIFFLISVFVLFLAVLGNAQNVNLFDKNIKTEEFSPAFGGEYWLSKKFLISVGYLPLSFSREERAIILATSNDKGFFSFDFCDCCYEVINSEGIIIGKYYNYFADPKNIDFKVISKGTDKVLGYDSYFHDTVNKWQSYEFVVAKERIDGVIPLDINLAMRAGQSNVVGLLGVGAMFEVGDRIINHARLYASAGVKILTGENFSLNLRGRFLIPPFGIDNPNKVEYPIEKNFSFSQKDNYHAGLDLDLFVSHWLGFKFGYNYFKMKTLFYDIPQGNNPEWNETSYEENIITKNVFTLGVVLRVHQNYFSH